MSSEISPQMQNQLQQLQQLQQQAQNLSMQKGQIASMQKESENALNELETISDDAVIYRSIGNLNIKVKKDETITKLKDQNESFSLKLQSITRQEERITKKFTQLQETLKQSMGVTTNA